MLCSSRMYIEGCQAELCFWGPLMYIPCKKIALGCSKQPVQQKNSGGGAGGRSSVEHKNSSTVEKLLSFSDAKTFVHPVYADSNGFDQQHTDSNENYLYKNSGIFDALRTPTRFPSADPPIVITSDAFCPI